MQSLCIPAQLSCVFVVVFHPSVVLFYVVTGMHLLALVLNVFMSFSISV